MNPWFNLFFPGVVGSEAQPASSIHAKVTAYKGKLLIELLTMKSIPNETHVSMDNPSVIGQVIMNTGKHLGVSKEALDIMKTIRRGSDGLGDIDWFKSGDTDTFGWIGGPKRIFDPKDGSPSRDWKVGAHVIVPNDVPDGAKEYIDSEG